MNDIDKLLIEISKDVAYIKGVIDDYPKIVNKTNDNETRSLKNEENIKEIKSTQKWLFRLVGSLAITWVASQIFIIIKG